jgi:hypothetical protein
VHHHLSVSSLNKATGLEVAFAQHLHLPTNNIITIGDSFNDGPLFDRTRFLTTVGVRAVLDHLPLLGANAPVYVSDGDASEGFSELAARLCAAQSG